MNANAPSEGVRKPVFVRLKPHYSNGQMRLVVDVLRGRARLFLSTTSDAFYMLHGNSTLLIDGYDALYNPASSSPATGYRYALASLLVDLGYVICL